jgi:hypothetical protein
MKSFDRAGVIKRLSQVAQELMSATDAPSIALSNDLFAASAFLTFDDPELLPTILEAQAINLYTIEVVWACQPGTEFLVDLKPMIMRHKIYQPLRDSLAEAIFYDMTVEDGISLCWRSVKGEPIEMSAEMVLHCQRLSRVLRKKD